MPSKFFERLTPEHSKLIAIICRFLLPIIVGCVSLVMLPLLTGFFSMRVLNQLIPISW